jgi:hypothetical protein
MGPPFMLWILVELVTLKLYDYRLPGMGGLSEVPQAKRSVPSAS